MKNKIWKIVVPILLIALFVAWYAFRPERLVVNEYVDEKLPAPHSGSAPEPLLLGLTWTYQNTGRFLFGANASVSISEPRR